jgi:hypothetical protein
MAWLLLSWGPNMRRLLLRLLGTFPVLLLEILFPPPCFSEPSEPASTESVRSFVRAYCVSCHSAEAKKGGLDLENLATDFKNPAVFEKWVRVHDRLRAGEMPPKERKKRPAPAENDVVVKSLNVELTRAETARRADVGRAVLRRLNRTEYENTVRDLLSLPGLNVKDMLPEDGRAFGFDKSSSALDLSYVQLAKYMEAADAALDAAIAPHAARPAYFRSHIPSGGNRSLAVKTLDGQTVFLKDFQYDDWLFPVPKQKYAGQSIERKVLIKEMAARTYKASIGVFKATDTEFKPKFPFTPVVAGRYKIRMSVWSFLWDKGQVKPSPRTEIGALVASGRTLGYFDAPSLKPTVTDIEVWLEPQEEFHFSAASLMPAFLFGRVSEYVRPGIAVDWLEAEGPLLDSWPPASHRRLFGDLPLVGIPPSPKAKGPAKKKGILPATDVHYPRRPATNAFYIKGHDWPFIKDVDSLQQKFENATISSKKPDEDARRLLADFLPRAFRRPVAAKEVDRYVKLFKAHLADGDLFEVAMRTAYKAALSSPQFLYLQEPTGALDDWALAARLSYFLWNSMPDDELFALAAKGKLRDQGVLRAQVERMLKDAKAQRFVGDFTDQWLDLAEIDATTPDKKLYPEFRRILRDAMLAEARAFFAELLDKDLSATNVIHSDFAMLNQRLAEHYGIQGVVGSAIRKVTLPEKSGRGGILTQAAVLKVTANGTVTSPVRRGVWVQQKILGQPPDSPPPNVPAIEPDVRGATTIREMLVKHRTVASCAACHDKIDPPGFALESYDVLGGLRTRYRALEGDFPTVAENQKGLGRPPLQYRLGKEVDCAGETADGKPFADLAGFKKLLLESPRPIAKNLAIQMIIYATGTPVGFSDRPTLESILDRTADGRHGIRSLVHEIVQSPLFLRK